jgi:hypothetical protein
LPEYLASNPGIFEWVTALVIVASGRSGNLGYPIMFLALVVVSVYLLSSVGVAIVEEILPGEATRSVKILKTDD